MLGINTPDKNSQESEDSIIPKPDEGKQSEALQSEIPPEYRESYDKYVLGVKRDILHEYGCSSGDELSKMIKDGTISIPDATVIRDKVQGIVTPEEYIAFFYPKGMPSLKCKERYDGKPVEVAKYHQSISAFQVLPNGDIVSGGADGCIYWHVKQPDGTYEALLIEMSGSAIYALQVLPNGDIVSGQEDGDANYHTKQPDGKYKHTLVGKHGVIALNLRALPNGDIVSSGGDKCIYYHAKQPDGTYEHILVGEHDDWIRALQVFPNGDIVSGGDDGFIYYHEKQADGKYKRKVVDWQSKWVITLQALFNGNIVSGVWDGCIYYHTKQANGVYEQTARAWTESSRHGLHDFLVLPNDDIVSGGANGLIYRHVKQSDGSYVSELLADHGSPIQALQLTREGNIVVGSLDGRIAIYT